MVWACPAVPIRDRLTFVVLRQGRSCAGSLRDRLLGEAALDPAPRTLGRLQIGAVGEGLDASGLSVVWLGAHRVRVLWVRPVAGGCWVQGMVPGAWEGLGF